MSDVQIILVTMLCVAFAAILFVVVAYVLHEWKWGHRERQVRWGGPAEKSLADRLTEYQIEAEHPDEVVKATNPNERELT